MRKAVASDPGSAPAHAILGKLLAAENQADEAIAEYKEALRLNPRFAQAEFELASLSLQQSKFADAIQFAQGAINTIPGYAEAHLVLTRALLANGDTAAAEKSLKVLMDGFPQDPTVQTELGRLLLAKGDVVAGRAAFERAIAKDPAQLGALDGLVTIDIHQKRSASARTRLDAAVKAAPANASLLVVAARHYVALGDEAAAERALKQALQGDAKNPIAYDLLARLYVKQERLPEATAEFEKLSSLQPKAVGPQTAVAVLLQVQNRMDEAAARYKKVLAIDPRAPVAANNLAQIYADRNENLDEALPLAQTAKAGLPNSSDVDDTLGWIYYKKKLTQLAVATLKLSEKAQPNNPLYLYHLGMAYAQSGDNDLARQTLEKALKNQANFDGADDARRMLSSLRN